MKIERTRVVLALARPVIPSPDLGSPTRPGADPPRGVRSAAVVPPSNAASPRVGSAIEERRGPLLPVARTTS
jgi:hypothetical protein